MGYGKIEKIQLVLPPPNRSDTTITKLSKLPQPVARYAQQCVFKLAEMALNRDSFGALLVYLSQLGCSDEKGTSIAKFARWPQPLGILSVGTYIKKNHPGVEVEILDGNNVLTLNQVIAKIDAEVVGISATALGYSHAINIAEIAKQKGATVILGGATATPLAKEILKHHDCVDAVIRYDGEIAFSKVVSSVPFDCIENLVYRDGTEIKENPVQLPCLDDLPVPDRDLLDMEAYFRNSKDPHYPLCDPFKRPVNIYSQKGCRWRSQENGGCVFCSIPYYDLRLRDPALVWDEITHLVDNYKADFIWDPSDNLVGEKEWFRAFCAAKPKRLDIHYTNYVDAEDVDEETARLLAESGCVSVFVGMDSGDPDMLKSMNKNATLEQNIYAMKMLQKYRIGVIAGVVIGVPGESQRSMDRTVDFLKRLTEFDNFDRFEWGTLIPFPGSDANRMLREHPDFQKKYQDFGNRNYLIQLMCMTLDWYKQYCDVNFSEILEFQNMIEKQGLVPYEMTMFQRRSWSGTPGKIFI